MSVKIDGIEIDETFLDEVSRLSGEDIITCYQCGKCTAGCPLADEMDFSPNQVMRCLLLNHKEPLLKSNSFWICSSCETCTTRCPKEIDIAKVMDTLRILSLQKLKKAPEHGVQAFNKAFLDIVKTFGRLHELSLVGKYKIATKKFFQDLILGIKMFFKGKIGLKPHKIDNIREMEKIFERSQNFMVKEKK